MNRRESRTSPREIEVARFHGKTRASQDVFTKSRPGKARQWNQRSRTASCGYGERVLCGTEPHNSLVNRTCGRESHHVDGKTIRHRGILPRPQGGLSPVVWAS